MLLEIVKVCRSLYRTMTCVSDSFIHSQAGVPNSKLETFVHSVYPIVHHSCLNLMNDFLEFKRAKGHNVEK